MCDFFVMHVFLRPFVFDDACHIGILCFQAAICLAMQERRAPWCNDQKNEKAEGIKLTVEWGKDWNYNKMEYLQEYRTQTMLLHFARMQHFYKIWNRELLR